jgi:hypothetical protein
MTDEGVTQPTIETVLERINALGLSMGERMEKIESEVSQMRQDINTGFRRVERKIELLNRDFLGIRGDNEDLLQRIESLESKAS